MSPNERAVFDYINAKLSKGYTYTNPWWAKKDLGIDGKEFLIILNRLKTQGLMDVDTSRLKTENHIYFSKPSKKPVGTTEAQEPSVSSTDTEKSLKQADSDVMERIAKTLERIANALERRP